MIQNDATISILVTQKILKLCIRDSVQGVESLWGDCRFIPADCGVLVVDLCYFALFEDFSP